MGELLDKEEAGGGVREGAAPPPHELLNHKEAGGLRSLRPEEEKEEARNQEVHDQNRREGALRLPRKSC